METRVFDKEIDSTLTDLIAHDRALAVIFTLAREAVGAVEVACVCDMKAQSLDLDVLLAEILCQMFVLIRGIELA